MRLNHKTKAGMVGAMLVGGSIFALPAVASASPTGTSGTPATASARFTQAQQNLESQLSSRVAQLGRLATDVTSSKTLSSAHMVLLSEKVSTATANINALVTKVPTDTTMAELTADRNSMLAQNRVYAVLTPQVFLTVEADGIILQAQSLQANEPTLQSAVSGLVGQHGYTNALNHYVAFVKEVNAANAASTNVDTAVLAQVPADYPGDTHVFVTANKQTLNADLALAHASYDASVVGLATGGYTGS